MIMLFFELRPFFFDFAFLRTAGYPDCHLLAIHGFCQTKAVINLTVRICCVKKHNDSELSK